MTAQVNDVPSGRRTRRTRSTTVAVLVALCALAAGCSSEAEDLGVVWDTPVDREAEQQGNGAWLSGDTLVRSRFDTVRGYDARTGKRSWEYVPPGRSAVCHATADTDSSVVVLTRDGEGAPASAKSELCTTAVAIDGKNSRELWQLSLSAGEFGLHGLDPSPLSAGGGIAVLLTKDELHAVEVRSGKPRWKAAVPQGCVPRRAAVAQRQVAALLACGGTERYEGDKIPGDAELHTAAFAPASGALLWSAPLGGRSTVPWNARADFVSADPVVVAASSSGDSESGAYFSFGGNGRPNPPIDFSGPYGEINLAGRLTVAVDDRRLYALPLHRVRNSRVDPRRLTAFDLATGDPVWGGTVDDDRLDGDTGYHIIPQDGKITVLTSRDETSFSGDRSTSFSLRVLDGATGEQQEVRSFPEDDDPVDTFFVYEGRLIGARYESYGSRSKPFTAYERR
ncbi:PQQ-binding-like beta-propeller repeat protein [Streptomyces sp. NPDC013953]|uniref:outer membrane protein assembly factor BamB family protein n=1 Tax=Streptomyces sp. NPDC013953 TaxID=3364868 RepID=UPI0036F7563F